VRRVSLVGFVLIGLGVTAILAAVGSGFASSSPDGLEKVAADDGILEHEEEHDLADSPVADYAVRAVDNDRLAAGLAGLIGIAVTFAAGCGLFFLVRRRTADTPTASSTAPPSNA